jgi:hydrogenase nickel incorporation protein HypB
MNRIPLEGRILKENDRIAAEFRDRFSTSGTLCLNFVSSPGAGKTALLERTLEAFGPRERVGVLTGDIQTDNDAVRLARFGFPVRQITTGGTCHLDARMVKQALADWRFSELDLLLIENVGNLVCPASYDLGEAGKIVVMSVTEGDDKPLKYPAIFYKAELLVLNKIDLLPYVPFDVARACANAQRVHPGMGALEVSCTTGAGLAGWRQWLRQRRQAFCREAASATV